LSERSVTIDSLSPARLLYPESIDELSRLLAAERGAVIPLGARTQTCFGNPLTRADCGVDLTGLSRITEYNPADVTIHVEAGVTLERLQATLLENNQFLPLDPWNGRNATIGGIAATNAQGPFRAVGTIRDWIIGMTVIHVDGRISKTGGRVVKNVTGYDLAKLYTGSIGSLAIIGEISLKLRTNFARTATVVGRFEDRTTAAAAVQAIRLSPVQPVACDWLGPENSIWLRFGEDSMAVDWQLKNLPDGNWIVEPDSVWDTLRQQYDALGPIVVKVVGMPAAVSEIIEEYCPKAWIAHALNGIVLMAVSGGDEVNRIRRKHRAVVERAPVEARRQIATFGLGEAEYILMKKLKDAFDPEGRLNPGRHVDGERPLS
jgi:glycolate oxidase FAD binding subunit